MGEVVYLGGAAKTLPVYQPAGATLAELGELFLAQLCAGKAPSTLAGVRYCLALATKGAAQVRPLPSHPTPKDVARWLSELRTGGGRDGGPLADGTVSVLRGHLMHLYRAAQACGWCTANPVAHVPFRRVVPQRRALKDVHGIWPWLLGVCATQRERALLCVLRFAGLRRGEALGLEWRHVDAVAGYLTVDQQRRRPNSLECTRVLKSEAARRRLPMRRELADALAELRREGNAQVWTGHGGQTLHTTELCFPFRADELAALGARLRGVAPADFPEGSLWHVFRHTVAVELWTAGKGEETIRQFLGHASLEKTAVYLRSLMGARVGASAIEGLDPPPESASPLPARSQRRKDEGPKRGDTRPGPSTAAGSTKSSPTRQSHRRSTGSTTKGRTT